MNREQSAKKAIKKLREAGFEAYMVGGCVRDRLRGETPGDFDLTVSAKPEEVLSVFCGEKTIKTGMRHGTVTVILDGAPLEITTYRVEDGYTDGRRPDCVRFTGNLKEDLSRRDFTINAMAWAPGEPIHDYFGGQEDLRNKIIRAIGSPKLRFEEDALRILRALRFASVLDFEIEEETRAALFAEKERLQMISRERIQQELLKMLMGDGVKRILTEYVDILGAAIPELLTVKNFPQDNGYHIFDIWEHTAVVVSEAPKSARLRMAALLHDIGKPDFHRKDEQGRDCFFGHGQGSAKTADKILRELKVSSSFRKETVLLIKNHDIYLHNDRKELKRWLRDLGPELLFDLIELKKADNRGQNIARYDGQKQLEKIRETVQDILESGECYSLARLAVSGNEIKDLPGADGPEIGRILERLLDEVIEGNVENQKEALLAFAKSL